MAIHVESASAEKIGSRVIQSPQIKVQHRINACSHSGNGSSESSIQVIVAVEALGVRSASEQQSIALIVVSISYQIGRRHLVPGLLQTQTMDHVRIPGKQVTVLRYQSCGRRRNPPRLTIVCG